MRQGDAEYRYACAALVGRIDSAVPGNIDELRSTRGIAVDLGGENHIVGGKLRSLGKIEL